MPFSEDGSVCKNIDIKNDIWSNEYIKKYPYGLIVSLTDREFIGNERVLNSGILLSESSVNDVLSQLSGKTIECRYNLPLIFNFPTNYINVDVSREKITDFTEIIDNRFFENLIDELFNQVVQLLNLSKVNKLHVKSLYLYNVLLVLINISKDISQLATTYNRIINMLYKPYIRLNDKNIEIILGSVNNPPSETMRFSMKKANKIRERFLDFAERNSIKTKFIDETTNRTMFNRIIMNPYRILNKYSVSDDDDNEILDLLYNRNYFHLNVFNSELSDFYKIRDNKILCGMLLFYFLQSMGENTCNLFTLDILLVLLKEFTISDVENGHSSILIEIDDFKKCVNNLKYNKNNSIDIV